MSGVALVGVAVTVAAAYAYSTGGGMPRVVGRHDAGQGQPVNLEITAVGGSLNENWTNINGISTDTKMYTSLISFSSRKSPS